MPPTPPGSNSSPNWCRRCPQIQDTSTGNPAFLTEVSQNSGHLHRILRLNPQARAVAQVPPSSGAGPFCWLRRSPFFRSRCLLLVAQVPLLPEQVPSAGGAGPPSSRASPPLPEQVRPSSGAGPPAKRSKSVFLFESCATGKHWKQFRGAGLHHFFGPAPGCPGTCANLWGDLHHSAASHAVTGPWHRCGSRRVGVDGGMCPVSRADGTVTPLWVPSRRGGRRNVPCFLR